ncbi:MAG: hypothetical protein QF718_09195 [Phycisphaerales bacterium]|nr:hypothetical protein [Phycisphaerales bacterium]
MPSPPHIFPGEVIAVTPAQGKLMEQAIDVSSYAIGPSKTFSPYSYSKDYLIPVPFNKNLHAHSVESIWQGLKVVSGVTDFTMFLKKPKKRRGIVQGHFAKERLLDITDARSLIYRPSYYYYLDNYVAELVKNKYLLRIIEDGVAFYDTEDNTVIEDTTAPLAHSAYLADYFQDLLTSKKEKNGAPGI